MHDFKKRKRFINERCDPTLTTFRFELRGHFENPPPRKIEWHPSDNLSNILCVELFHFLSKKKQFLNLTYPFGVCVCVCVRVLWGFSWLGWTLTSSFFFPIFFGLSRTSTGFFFFFFQLVRVVCVCVCVWVLFGIIRYRKRAGQGDKRISYSMTKRSQSLNGGIWRILKIIQRKGEVNSCEFDRWRERITTSVRWFRK